MTARLSPRQADLQSKKDGQIKAYDCKSHAYKSETNKHEQREYYAGEALSSNEERQYISKKHKFVMNAPLQMTSAVAAKHKYNSNHSQVKNPSEQQQSFRQHSPLTMKQKQFTPIQLNKHHQLQGKQSESFLRQRKTTSNESTSSEKHKTKMASAREALHHTGLQQPLGPLFICNAHKDQFNTTDNGVYYQQKKTDIQVFKELLDDKLQQIQFYIDKAEQAQTERQRSSSISKRRSQRAITARASMTPRKDNLEENDYLSKGMRANCAGTYMSQSASKKSLDYAEQVLGTIQDNNVSATDNEEETKILQMLTQNKNYKKNERYKSQVCNPTIESQEFQKQSIIKQGKVGAIDYPLKEQLNPEEIIQYRNFNKIYEGKGHSFNQNQQQTLEDQQAYSKKVELQQQEHYTQLQMLEQRLQDMNKINEKITEENKKLTQKYKHVQKKVVDYKCRCKLSESQLQKQQQINQAQQNERTRLLNTVQVQEEQIKNLKHVLNQSLATKIKYENIFKRLLEDDNCRDKVLCLLKM